MLPADWTKPILKIQQHAFFALRHIAEARNQSSVSDGDGHRTKPRHLVTGERGEDEAYFYLRGLGHTIVARRWRTGNLRGDLDIVGWDGDTLVIFEVKTRTARDFAAAEAEVDRDKQRMLRRMAAAYVRQLPERHRDRVPVRFDVIAVYLLASGTEFEHFRSAFITRNEPA